MFLENYESIRFDLLYETPSNHYLYNCWNISSAYGAFITSSGISRYSIVLMHMNFSSYDIFQRKTYVGMANKPKLSTLPISYRHTKKRIRNLLANFIWAADVSINNNFSLKPSITSAGQLVWVRPSGIITMLIPTYNFLDVKILDFWTWSQMFSVYIAGRMTGFMAMHLRIVRLLFDSGGMVCL